MNYINHKDMRKIAIFSGIIFTLLTGCNSAETARPVHENTVKIRVHPVQYKEYKIPVRAVGMLGTSTQMKLSFKTGGLVSQINVSEGESVKVGQSLAALDLSEVKAHVDQARIGFEKARRDMDRARNLYKDSVATLEQYQNAVSAYELAASQRKIADFNLLHSKINAPSNGKIQKLLVESNEMIAPGYPAILFASAENEWVVKVALTDKDIVKLSLGDSAIVTMDAFPEEEMIAEIIELGAIADPLTGTYLAELLLHTTFPQFRAGFIAHANIFPAGTSRSLLVPFSTLLEASDHSAIVYTYSEGEVLKKRVETGMIIDDAIVILDGLKEGESVVTDGLAYLGKDTKVELINNQESNNE